MRVSCSCSLEMVLGQGARSTERSSKVELDVDDHGSAKARYGL